MLFVQTMDIISSYRLFPTALVWDYRFTLDTTDDSEVINAYMEMFMVWNFPVP